MTRPVPPAAAVDRPTADVPGHSSRELAATTPTAELPASTTASPEQQAPASASDPTAAAEAGPEAGPAQETDPAAAVESSVAAREAYEPSTEASDDFTSPELPVFPPQGLSDTGVSDGLEPGSESTPRPENSALTPSQVLAAVSAAGGRIQTRDDGTVYSIDLSLTEAGDAQIQGISAVPSLLQLDLSQTRVQDTGLAEVSQLELLRSLKLRGTKVTDVGIRQLSALTGLLLLDLSGTAVTDDGLVNAAKWRRLRYLSLTDTAITDTGLLHLQALRELRGLNIAGTKVTAEGARALKSVLPECLLISNDTEILSRRIRSGESHRIAGFSPASQSEPRTEVTDSEQLSHVVALAGRQPRLAVHLSELYTRRGQWAAAAQVLQAAFAADEQNAEIQYRLARALVECGELDQAMLCFRRSGDDSAASHHLEMIRCEQMLRNCENQAERSLAAAPDQSTARERLRVIQAALTAIRRNAGPRSDMAAAVLPEIVPGTHRFRSPEPSAETASPVAVTGAEPMRRDFQPSSVTISTSLQP